MRFSIRGKGWMISWGDEIILERVDEREITRIGALHGYIKEKRSLVPKRSEKTEKKSRKLCGIIYR